MLSLNGTELKFGTYPNGEMLLPKFNVNPRRPGRLFDTYRAPLPNEIVMKWESDQDLINLYFLQSYIRYTGGQSLLEIPYMPYSRMDRNISEQGKDNCSLAYVANMINTLNFVCVTVWDPHSKKTLEWLNNSEAVYPAYKMIKPMCEAVKFNALTDYLILPDKGAKERYGDFGIFNVATFTKHRNFESGRIENMELDDAIPPYLKSSGEIRQAIILDDLCSYGGTFIMAAGILFAQGFDKVHLLVTHLEEAAFKGELLDTISTVWASDSMQVPWAVYGWFDQHNLGEPRVKIYTKEEWDGTRN